LEGQPFPYLRASARVSLGVFARGRVREEERTDPESGDARQEFIASTPPAIGVLHTPTGHFLPCLSAVRVLHCLPGAETLRHSCSVRWQEYWDTSDPAASRDFGKVRHGGRREYVILEREAIQAQQDANATDNSK